MATIGAIFARGGSKGIPKKNLSKIGDQNLIQISINHLVESNLCKEVYLCSDDDEILSYAEKLQIKKFVRSDQNCQDNSPEINAWKELCNFLKLEKNYKENDKLLIAPATSPLRKINTLKKVVNKLDDYPSSHGVLCIKKSTILPDFNLLKIQNNGFLSTYLGGERAINRQLSKEAWEMTTIAYCFKLGSILNFDDIFKMSLVGLEVDFPESLDIDTNEDLIIARSLY